MTHPQHAFDTPRSASRAELVWYLRHAAALGRWPVIGEPWARAIERRRLDEAAHGRAAATSPGPPREPA